MKLTDKIIFLISYEKWGDMLMSKHHYAIELARRGNKIYFLNSPDRLHRLKRGQILIRPTKFYNLYSVEHKFIHPFFFKHKFKLVYKFLTSIHIKKIIRAIGETPDIVFSFDAGNNLPLSSFSKNTFSIYMPVDGPFNHIYELDAGNSADVIISVTSRILQRYNHISAPKLLLNHGVADIFINQYPSEQMSDPIRIGYSGSLVRNDLDVIFFMKIIKEHSDKIFEFWGENDPASSSIHLPQDISESTKQFLVFLQNSPNVILHGAVTTEELAIGLQQVDALLIAYIIKNDQNHHKCLEYLGSGKVIISSYMSSYSHLPELMEMIKPNEGTEELTALFSRVIGRLPEFNTIEKQSLRICYAKKFTYSMQVSLIEQFIQFNQIKRHEKSSVIDK